MDNFLKTKNIVKIALVIFPTLFWIYFLVSSKLTFETLIIFDIVSIFNSLMTLNFLLFLVFFPLTSVVVLSIGFNTPIKESLLILVVSFVFVFLASLLLFKLNLFFYIFIFLYFVVHFIVSYLMGKKSQESYKSLYDLTSNQLSKLASFLIIAVFLCGLFYILPIQKKSVEQMEIGIIGAFVSDNMDSWMDTSYSISTQCTKANLEYITMTSQFKNLEKKTDPESVAFTEMILQLNNTANEKKTKEEIKALYPELDSAEIKQKTMDTIKSIPFMVIVENFFAVIFMLFICSLAYTYLSIVFLFYALLIFVFNKIFEEK